MPAPVSRSKATIIFFSDSDRGSRSKLCRPITTPSLRQDLDEDPNARPHTEEKSIPLIYKLLVVAVMVGTVAAAMLFVLLVRTG
jgi:hypothetical protein